MLDTNDLRTVVLPGQFGDSRDGPQLPSLKDVAFEHVRRAIVLGVLPPGEKVAQDEVADELGISRLPVREAVIELTAKGYVKSIPRRGAFVVRLTRADILDHFEVLAAVFSLTARHAAESIDARKLDELRALHAQIAAASGTPSIQALDTEFYRTVNRIGSSDRLLAILQSLWLALPNDFLAVARSRTDVGFQLREELLGALGAGDADTAAALAHAHLADAGRVTIEHLEARGYWADDEERTGPQ
jgi:DNA-binding GntR family transcriptional regulator